MERIDTKRGREGLQARREPYFYKLARGRYLGLRKLTPESTGTWIARYREDSGEQRYQSLGECSDKLDFDDAKQAAFLLTRGDGRPWAHSDWDELVKETAKNAGLPAETCLYTLRHSFITQVLIDGMSTLEVSKMVGTSLQMIEKHYGHLVHSTARERLAKVQMV